MKLSTCLECIWHWRAAAGTGDGDDGDATMQSAPLTRAKGNGAEAREMPLNRAISLGWEGVAATALSRSRLESEPRFGRRFTAG